MSVIILKFNMNWVCCMTATCWFHCRWDCSRWVASCSLLNKWLIEGGALCTTVHAPQQGTYILFLAYFSSPCVSKLYIFDRHLFWVVGFCFSGIELDISVTQLPKYLRLRGITNQFPFVYTIAKCQYKLLSLSFIIIRLLYVISLC